MILVIFAVWIVLAGLYQARPRLAAVIYLLALPIFPFYWAPFDVSVLNDVSAQQLVAGGIGLGLLVETLRQQFWRRSSPGFRREVAVALVIVLWSVSALAIATPSGAFRELLRNLLAFCVPFSLGLRLGSDERQVRFLWRWIAGPAVAVGVLTLWEYLTREPVAWSFFRALASNGDDAIWAPATRAGILRVQATLGQSIFLAFYLAFGGVLALTQAGVATGKGTRLATYAAGAFLAICSLLPLARGAMLALAAAILATLPLGRRGLRRDAIVGLLVALGALFFLASVLADAGSFWGDFALTLTGRASTDVQAQQLGNLESRVDLLDVGPALILAAPPLGYGDISVHGTWPIADVANAFVEVGLVAGPVGLGALLLVVLAAIRGVARLWWRASDEDERAVVAGLAAGLILVLGSWLDASWPGQFTQLGWLTFGIISATGRWRAREPRDFAPLVFLVHFVWWVQLVSGVLFVSCPLSRALL